MCYNKGVGKKRKEKTLKKISGLTKISRELEICVSHLHGLISRGVLNFPRSKVQCRPYYADSKILKREKKKLLEYRAAPKGERGKIGGKS